MHKQDYYPIAHLLTASPPLLTKPLHKPLIRPSFFYCRWFPPGCSAWHPIHNACRSRIVFRLMKHLVIIFQRDPTFIAPPTFTRAYPARIIQPPGFIIKRIRNFIRNRRRCRLRGLHNGLKILICYGLRSNSTKSDMGFKLGTGQEWAGVGMPCLIGSGKPS